MCAVILPDCQGFAAAAAAVAASEIACLTLISYITAKLLLPLFER